MGIVTNTAEAAESWTLNVGDEGIHLILSEQEVTASDILGDQLSGQSLTLSMLPTGAPLPQSLVAEAKAVDELTLDVVTETHIETQGCGALALHHTPYLALTVA